MKVWARLRNWAVVFLVGSSMAAGLVVSPLVHAATDPLKQACTAQSSSPTCSGVGTTTNPLTGANGLLLKVSKVIALIGGISAVIVMIAAGARYVSSGGDAQKAAGARNAVIGALVGLAIIALAEAIITVVIMAIEN